jgi:uncharacterized membrane protein (UPF0182 family)
MVSKVAPFLQVDGDPFPFVDQATGHIMWMVDGYTTMANYPYSERESLSDLTADSLSTAGRTAKQPNDQINYIRNSVKATVDAYTGKVTLYDWDSTDPVLKAWSKTFPGLLTPANKMPQDVLDHVRYPEDLFEVQRALIGSYHVDSPVTFYNVGDKWTVPADPADATANQPPYYVLAAAPDGSSNAPEFQLTSPMIVNNRQNLAAYISVNSNPGPDYGKFTVLTVPTSTNTNGPEQVFNILNTNSVITKDLSLFNTTGGGSRVRYGNLLTLPVGNSFLYVEPLYIEGTGSAAFPSLQRVLVVYGNDKIGYASNLAGALSNLNDSQVGVTISNPGSNTSSSPPPSSSTSPPPSSSTSPSTSTPPATGTVNSVLSQLDSALSKLQDDYKSGNLAAIGADQQLILDLTQQYQKLRSPTPSSGATLSGSSPPKTPSTSAARTPASSASR